MDLSVKQLEEAVSVRRQIDQLQSRLSSLLGGSSTGGSSSTGKRRGRPVGSKNDSGESSESSNAGTKTRKRRGLSKAGRERIAAAARARWARTKAESGGNSSTESSAKTSSKKSSSKKKSGGKGISAAGRKKLSQMMKARWAARRKAQGK